MQVVDVHKKSLKDQGHASLEAWLASDTDHIYIGRRMFNVKGAERSKWANPFCVKKHGLDECIRLYREHLRDSGLVRDLHELEGKTLGCWCVNDDCKTLKEGDIRCHGQLLVQMCIKRREDASVTK